MPNDAKSIPEWREFEQLVARIEADARSLGLIVKSPDFIRSAVTGDLREVDASIRSSLSGSETLITVECRRRSSKEDVTWIEQLATKKQAIGAERTIAVSSSGFSSQAQKAAVQYGIDLQLLSKLSITDINPRLRLDLVLFNHKRCSLAQVQIRRYTNVEWKMPANDFSDCEIFSSLNQFDNIFLNTETGHRWSLNDLWLQVQEIADPFADVQQGAPPILRTACFPFPGNVTIDGDDGPVRLGDVIMSMLIAIDVEQINLDEAHKIGYSGTGVPDLQRLEFRSAHCAKEWSVAVQMPNSAKDYADLRTRLVSPDDSYKS